MKRLVFTMIVLFIAIIAISQPTTTIQDSVIIIHRANKDVILLTTPGKSHIGYDPVTTGNSIRYFSNSGLSTNTGLSTLSPLPIDSINTINVSSNTILVIKRQDEWSGTIIPKRDSIKYASYGVGVNPIVRYIDVDTVTYPNVIAKNINQSYDGLYFVSNSGNNSYSGTKPDSAWATMAKVNATQFAAGDFIAFEKGDVWREALVVPSSGSSGSPIVFGAYGTGDNPVFDGADVINNFSKYSGGIYRKGDVTTTPYILSYNDTIRELQTSIANCDTIGEWFYNATTDSLYLRSDATSVLDTIYGSDLLSGWNFTNGWAVVATATIGNANTFTTTANLGGIAKDANTGSANLTYKIRLAGTTTSTDLRLLNYNTGVSHISVAGTFDTIVYITPTIAFRARFRDYGGTNTTTITAFTFELVSPVLIVDASIELGQRDILLNASSRNNITVNNLTFTRSNAIGTNVGPIYTTGSNYLTVNGCSFIDNNLCGIAVLNSQYVTVDNNIFLRNGLKNNAGHGFSFWSNISRPANVIFKNNNVSYSGWNGAVIYTSAKNIRISNVAIYNNHFEYCKGAGAYPIRCDTVVVYNNTFDSNGESATSREDYAFGSESCNYLDFYNNTITNQLHNDAVQIYSDIEESHHHTRIFRNYIDGVANGDCIGIHSLDNLTSENIQIFSNVLINADHWGIRHGTNAENSGMASKAYIYNNTIYNNAIGAVGTSSSITPIDLRNNILWGYVQVPTLLTSSNNLWYQTSGTLLTYNSTDYTSATISTFEATAQTGDPLFTNPATGDFTLQAGSPAINAGVNVGLTQDILGNPIVGLPEIGAYEYIAP